jgi:hypothetical protein
VIVNIWGGEKWDNQFAEELEALGGTASQAAEKVGKQIPRRAEARLVMTK